MRLEQGQRAGRLQQTLLSTPAPLGGRERPLHRSTAEPGFPREPENPGSPHPHPFLLPSPSPAPSQPSSACPSAGGASSELPVQGTRTNCSTLQSPACKSSFPCGLCTAVLRFPLSTFHSRFQAAPVPARSFVLQAHRRAGACWALQCSGDLSSPAPIGRQPGVSAVFGTPITALQPPQPSSQSHSRGGQGEAALTCTGHASDVAGFADEILHDRQHTELVPGVLEHQTHLSGPPHSLQPRLTRPPNIPRINKTL